MAAAFGATSTPYFTAAPEACSACAAVSMSAATAPGCET